MDPIYINSKQLPTGDNCTFGPAGTELPTPEQVRSKAEHDGHDTSKTFRPEPVRFPELGLIVKWGEDITIAEGQCLWVLRQHLREEVPVPTIHGWRRQAGDSMASRWNDLSEDDRLSICSQLHNMIMSWRRIKPSLDTPGLFQRFFAAFVEFFNLEIASETTPKCHLSAINGDGLRDIIFCDAGSYPAGPFANISEFHDAYSNLLMQDGTRAESISYRKRNQELAGLRDDIPVVFTHADLDFSNILLSDPQDGPVCIKAVIDWHQSGWYPEPWEWLKSQSVVGPHSDWAKKYLSRVLKSVPHDYFYAWEYISMSTI
ncbi:hypothetical protein CERZMDRAFT_113422 [Cercospora zeae-maydis SCOH1-5]|uniref:Aminoglycoside phosphotransferase domain-containing protein n=1 Tax=Cercospora zeae-maydis SCOH1-5 TaxID=717836 RepID=A0A6A6F9W3_9PEZI|nr:hypothetical protein CERZMDRAFT_113422 [Cercospora zeae-maydis SCOH1-5]